MALRFQGVPQIHWTRHFEGAIANLESRASFIENILVKIVKTLYPNSLVFREHLEAYHGETPVDSYFFYQFSCKDISLL